ncbi:hypothetical protein GCM10010300_77720 [Streptomyces olivaceoviridis]|nr:hypothetical protein GCM10010300_77720 [Streptomyces olivaceoviridis]
MTEPVRVRRLTDREGQKLQQIVRPRRRPLLDHGVGPTAWAWEKHTRAVAHRAGRTPTPAEDTALLHDDLRLSIDRIATITGTDPARVTALLAAARRPQHPPTGRPQNCTPYPQPPRTACRHA